MNKFEEEFNRICNTEFTELRIKPLTKIHDSGYRCFEITGYNAYTKEELLITTVADVIGFPCMPSPYDLDFSVVKIDYHPDKDYFRIFVGGNYRIVPTWILSDFEFKVIDKRGAR